MKRSITIKKFLLIRMLIPVILCLAFSKQLYSQDIRFSSPVEFPIILSANFGELRTDHFHSGIDIKTEGASGKRILAVEEGYVSRISVSPGGFGKALYINHPNGYTTVYGHLSKFTDEVEKQVKEQQYQEKTFRLNIFPDRDEFTYNKGEVIGFSGNTGSSFGPHLHFEVRHSKTQVPLNPMLFSFDIEDTLPPVIYNLFLYPLTEQSHVNFTNDRKKIKINRKNGKFILNNDTPLEVGGSIGLGIETNDFLNGARNKCGVYSIEILLDQATVYLLELDQFSFSESRYINSHIDYREKIRSNTSIHQSYVAPNNKLSIYKSIKDHGRLSFYDNEIHEITIIIRDVNHNESILHFNVTSSWEPGKIPVSTGPTYSRIMFPDMNNSYKHNGVQVEIPSGALYDTLYFSYAKSPPAIGYLSEVHHVHDRFTPVHLNYTLRIKPDNPPEEMGQKLLIALIDEENELISMGGEYKDGMVETQTRNFGRFTILADTVAPVITPLSPLENMDLSARRTIRFKITDDLSGIRSYNGYIDNEWVLFEYDAKNDRLIYRFDRERLQKNRNHELVLTVIDNKENISVFHANFYW